MFPKAGEYFRELRLGKPAPAKGEGGLTWLRADLRTTDVYVLRSLEYFDHYYIGVTSGLRGCLEKHNAGKVARHMPWRQKTYVAFSDENQAFAFEKYLKSASGRAFAKSSL